MLKKSVKGTVKDEDEQFMRLVCRALDTNSFETAVVQDDSTTSLRALFPMGALTNHQCVPNTRHHVNEKGQLLVYAAKPIAQGDEITMSYTDLMWDTTLRRQFLMATKHFLCHCPRCCDVTVRCPHFCVHPRSFLRDLTGFLTSGTRLVLGSFVVRERKLHGRLAAPESTKLQQQVGLRRMWTEH